jgi:hypothetical protein
MGLEVCDACFGKLKVNDVMKREDLLPIAHMCGRTAGVTVDVDATKVVRVELDDPEYLILKRRPK